MSAVTPPTAGSGAAERAVDVVRAVNGVLLPGFTGTDDLPTWLVDAARDGLAGVVLFGHNTPDVATTARLTARLRGASSDLLVAVDEEGGDVSRLEAATGSSLPGNAALGLVDDVAVTEEVGAALGRLLTATGVDLDLAPDLDVNSDPDNPVIGVRSFGADPALVARHGAAFVRGLHAGGAGACGKHFPGHGATNVDSHLALPVVDASLDELRARDLPPFVATIAPGDGSDDALLDAVMTAHVVVPALGPLPATLRARRRRARARARVRRPDRHRRAGHGCGRDVRGVRRPVPRRRRRHGAARHRRGRGPRGRGGRRPAVPRHDRRARRRGPVPPGAARARGRRRVRSRRGRAPARVRRTHGAHPRRGPRAPGGERRRPSPESAHAALDALDRVGARVAARAVRLAGPAPQDPPVTAAPDVVDLRLRFDHAAGRTAQHVQRALDDAFGPDVRHLRPADAAAWARTFDAVRAGDRPLVVLTREPVPGSGEHERLTELLTARPDAAVVHTRFPGAVDAWSGADRTVVVTCGTGRANARAAVALLRGPARPRAPSGDTSRRHARRCGGEGDR